ncbi:MAG TPA: non-homologous end-joining DNA ligase, partial [Candidatus Sulfotelmatobacter sp.]|nr:non-homologous end-joining DNA ligase [Candidatus Sulfotelmatobacter sp.]
AQARFPSPNARGPRLGNPIDRKIALVARLRTILVKIKSNYEISGLRDRPITLKRYPDGVDGLFFYEKRCPPHRPDWVETHEVPRSEGGKIDFCVMNSLPALVWAVNLADLELHVFLHRAPKIMQPTAVVFDLDPGAPADITDCCQTALRLKSLLDKAKLKSFPKTSGSKGLQIYVPLNRAATYEQTKAFARGIAAELEKAFPESIVSNMQKSLRKGKVFVDWSQNDDHKTTVCVYSMRAKETPAVSTPITWDEVEAGKDNGTTLVFEPEDVLKRVEKHGDLFAPVLKLKQSLPSPDFA